MARIKKPSSFYTTLSTTIVLVLISLFLLLYFHTNNITNIVKENINILVELEDNLPQGAIDDLKSKLANNPNIIPSSVAFVSKESALKIMSKDIEGLDIDENPFKNIIEFNIKSANYSDATVQQLKTDLNLEKGVIGIYHENESLEDIKSNIQRISLGILVLAVVFIVLALSIIFNTIRLTLLNDKKLIKTMQMVGANPSFIKKPYLREVFFVSVQAALITVVIIGGLIGYLVYSQNIFGEVIQWPYVLVSVALAFLSAFFILILTSNSTINSFLAKE